MMAEEISSLKKKNADLENRLLDERTPDRGPIDLRRKIREIEFNLEDKELDLEAADKKIAK